MNIPEVYLVEPYNAYTTQIGGRKKHWHEVIEEQALMQRIIAEADGRNSSNGHVATAVAVATTAGNGAGGSPHPLYFNPSMNISFSVSPSTITSPGLVSCNNSGDSSLISLTLVKIQWVFGDGIIGSGANPVPGYTTTGSFKVQMTASALNNSLNIVTSSATVTVNAPSVIASFTLQGSSVTLTSSFYTASKGSSIRFANGTISNNSFNNISYLWNFGSGSNLTSSIASPNFVFNNTGSYTVLLSATGSFNITSSSSRLIQII